jgi:hypothetical protein
VSPAVVNSKNLCRAGCCFLLVDPEIYNNELEVLAVIFDDTRPAIEILGEVKYDSNRGPAVTNSNLETNSL